LALAATGSTNSTLGVENANVHCVADAWLFLFDFAICKQQPGMLK